MYFMNTGKYLRNHGRCVRACEGIVWSNAAHKSSRTGERGGGGGFKRVSSACSRKGQVLVKRHGAPTRMLVIQRNSWYGKGISSACSIKGG